MTGQGSWNESTSSKSSEKSQFRPNDFMYTPNWQLKEFLGKFAWRLKPLFRIIMAYWPFDIYNSRYIFCKPFYNIARKFVFSNSIARAYFIFLLCTLMTSTNKSLEEKNFPSGWKCYKTIGSYVSCAFIKIWSTWEVWRALKKLDIFDMRNKQRYQRGGTLGFDWIKKMVDRELKEVLRFLNFINSFLSTRRKHLSSRNLYVKNNFWIRTWKRFFPSNN